MKNRYLKSLTARVTILMLSFLCEPDGRESVLEKKEPL